MTISPATVSRADEPTHRLATRFPRAAERLRAATDQSPVSDESADATASALAGLERGPAASPMLPPLFVIGVHPARARGVLERLGATRRPIVFVEPNPARLRAALSTGTLDDLFADTRVRLEVTDDILAGMRDAFDRDPAFTFHGAGFVAGAPGAEADVRRCVPLAQRELTVELTELSERTQAWKAARKPPTASQPWSLFGTADVSTTALQHVLGDLMDAARRDGHDAHLHFEDSAHDPFRALRRLRALLDAAPNVFVTLVQSGAENFGDLARDVATVVYYSSDPARYRRHGLSASDHVFVADPAWTGLFANTAHPAQVLPLATGFGSIAVHDRESRWHCDALLVGHLTDMGDVLAETDTELRRVIDDLGRQLAHAPNERTSDQLVASSSIGERETAHRELARAVEVQATWHLRRDAAIAMADAGIDVRIYGDTRWRSALAGTAAESCYRGLLDYRNDMPHALAGARVVVNICSLNAPEALNMRAFDVPAVGGCLLTDDRPGVHDAFIPGVEIVTYQSAVEIPTRVQELLDDPARRDAIATAGRDRVRRDHSWSSRWSTIANALRSAATLTILWLVALGFGRHALASDALTSPKALGEVGSLLHRYLTAAEATGFCGTALVALDDTIVLHQSYGLADREHDRPVTLSTRFDLGELTKPFVAATILRLAADGVLSIDDSIGRYVTEFAAPLGADKTPITLRHLMNQTSGLPNELPFPGVGSHDRRSGLRALLNAELETTPGTTFRDNDLGYVLLASIIESITETAFQTALRDRAFAPAGLTDTGFCGDRDISPDSCARGWLSETEAPPAVRDTPEWHQRGATGILTTAADLYRWFTMLRGGAILPPPQLDTIFVANHANATCGWTVLDHGDRHLTWQRGSTRSGHTALIRHEMDRSTETAFTLILLSNSAAPFASVTGGVIDILRGTPVEIPRIPVVPAPNELAALAGPWSLADHDARIELTVQGHGLQATPFGQAAVNLLSPGDGYERNLEVLNRSVDRAVRGLMAGAFQPFRDLMAPNIAEDWPERLHQHLKIAMESCGGYTRHEVIGSGVGDADTLITSVYLYGPGGIHPITFRWAHGAINEMKEGQLALRHLKFEPVARDRFAAYDLSTRHVVELHVQRDSAGDAISITVGAVTLVRGSARLTSAEEQ